MEAFEDALYALLEKLHTACVVVAPEASIEHRNKLASEALYSFSLAMQFGMMEADTIGDNDNRRFVADPMSEWIAWANPIRDELGDY